MALHEIDSAVLFTPGRASYVTSQPNGGFTLNLTAASQQRAETAAELFDINFHERVLFAGGYPGLAQHWPQEHIDGIDTNEARLMSAVFKDCLRQAHRYPGAVRMEVQGNSNNSIGDVRLSIEHGLLTPDDFHTADRCGIHLVTGGLHGHRFRNILVAALDIDPARIVRADIRDPYGTPATEFRGPESKPVAIAKELAAITLTQLVLRNVQPGDITSLREAEEQFTAKVQKTV